jgi:mono/diheme cytochrome c family protein
MNRSLLTFALVALLSEGVWAEAQSLIPEGPSRVRAGDVGVGRQLPDAGFTTLDGRLLKLSDLQEGRGLVIAMTSSSCPVSRRYARTLSVLQEKLAQKRIGLLLVNPFASENPEEVASFIKEHHLVSPYVNDAGHALAVALRASSTTEVMLVDSNRTLVYRGAIDDQFGLGYHLSAPRNTYLLDAVEALLAGQPPLVPATEAPGCEIDLPLDAAASAGSITYHRDVARILQQNCIQCHRPRGIAPFALESVDEVRDRAKTIRRVVEQGHMPPWFAAPVPAGTENPWANDRSLSPRDKADLLAWVNSSDRPVGDFEDAPAPLSFPEHWSIPKPDLVLQLPTPFFIKAEGAMPYQTANLDTGLSEDKWVEAMEILPTERDVVHHVLVQILEKGSDAGKKGDGAGSFWAAYVPGNGARIFPKGFGRRLPAGAKLAFQIHYTPNGRAGKEQMRIGLVFAKEPPEFESKVVGVQKRDLSIPAYAANHVETREQAVPFDLHITSFMPHMHVRGKAFKYEALYADGRTETLLDIPHYDFNWQLSYDLKQPKFLPRGSRVRVTGVFDNSTENKANPDPSKLVKWGPQSYDEMLIGYLEIFTANKSKQ